MARTQSSALSLTFLIFSIILNPSSSSSSSSHQQQFQFLDVAASLQQARQVFSSNLAQINPDRVHQQKTLNYSPDSFFLPLHSRSSLPFNNYNSNYTSLTLSRLARDAARVHFILSKHSLAIQRHSRNSAPNPVRHPDQLESPVISGIRQGSGEYFARIGVGRPAKEFYMVIDSGSDVIWLQCDPCSACYDQTDPIFDPSASSTYKALSCNSAQCTSLEVSACRTDTCLYQVSYGDGSFTVGTFAAETISFGSSGSVPNVALGCGHDNEGLFAGAAGLLGLGGGSLSLPSQIRATSFSYCLVSRDSSTSSTLEFNSGQPADSIVAPLLTNPRVKTYRYVGLTGIDVGGRPVPIPPNAFTIGEDGRGGIIVDSGTAVTRLRSDVYSALRDAFVSLSQNLPRASGFSLFDTCYDFSSMATARVPTVAFRFSGGKTLQLPPHNYLIPVDSQGKFCFAFAGTRGSLSIIGNVQQQGTRVSYNLANKYIAFSPNKC
ncbi:Aspartyl protease [Handroanthus impetiginosus]|uniref:Aspartyl protease n=1 Tax=Handroanthus impetiginosus TaxID=429701 RepID=A0A2G9HB65_9LAMI|nr:Aspartyl protease [Handroanthus impetiginosus]